MPHLFKCRYFLYLLYLIAGYHSCTYSNIYLDFKLATMESVRGVNVPMYTTLRRTTVVFTMLAEYILAGQKYTPPVIGR